MRRLIVPFAIFLVLLTGCGGSFSSSACDPGDRKYCTCDNGSVGTRTCIRDEGFNECACSAPGNPDLSTDGIYIYVNTSRTNSADWYTAPSDYAPLVRALMKEGFSIEVQDRTSNSTLQPEDIQAYDMAWVIEADTDTTPQLQNPITSSGLTEADTLNLLPVWVSAASPPFAESLNTAFDELGFEPPDRKSPIGFHITQSSCREDTQTDSLQLTDLTGMYVVSGYPTGDYSVSFSSRSAPIDIDPARRDAIENTQLNYWAETTCGDFVYQTTPTLLNQRRGLIADSGWLLSAPARDTSPKNLDLAADIADWMLNHW